MRYLSIKDVWVRKVGAGKGKAEQGSRGRDRLHAQPYFSAISMYDSPFQSKVARTTGMHDALSSAQLDEKYHPSLHVNPLGVSTASSSAPPGRHDGTTSDE